MYRYWQQRVAGENVSFIDEPQCGFYRRRPFRGAAWQPVAIYFVDDTLHCLVSGRLRPPHEVWSPFLQAVPEQVYRNAVAAGRFPDDYETHRYAPTAHSHTTELRYAKPVLPLKE
jgi:hypothetical protein